MNRKTLNCGRDMLKAKLEDFICISKNSMNLILLLLIYLTSIFILMLLIKLINSSLSAKLISMALKSNRVNCNPIKRFMLISNCQYLFLLSLLLKINTFKEKKQARILESFK